ncbi:MAG: homocysteine S-methyltransferase, partial [Bacteroidetes bacterium]
ERRGADLNDSLWSARLLLEDPAAIRAVHADYLRAGAEVLSTATYQATPQRLRERGLGQEEVEGLFHLAVRLAREAVQDVGRPARVAASVGPYGAYLADGSEYRGAYGLTREELFDFHEERFRLLAAGEADLLALETLPSFPEAEALLRLLQKYPHKPAWFSFQCRDGGHLADGTPLAEVGRLLDGVREVVAVGVNCVPPQRVLPAVLELRRTCSLPLIAYPNSGEEWDAENHRWRGSPQTRDWLQTLPRWFEAGVRFFGGCCRTTPETIRRMQGILAHIQA